MYLHERENWWDFSYDAGRLLDKLSDVRAKQGRLMGEMSAMGFSVQDEAVLSTMTLDVLKSSEIEGERLDMEQVRSSIALHLGLPCAGLAPISRYIDGVVAMTVDAVEHYRQPLTDERLFGWHGVLFPTGRSGLYQIDVARYRTHAMQVVSGAMGHERVHYEAPEPQRVEAEIRRLIDWINADNSVEPVLKAAIAHLWFVTIHPFDDGNGRIARAITDMLLARADGSSKRFYSMSNEILKERKQYYLVLEKTQRGEGDITDWLIWFLECLSGAVDTTETTLSAILAKARFWENNDSERFNDRQRQIINLLFDGFEGKLTTSKWAKIGKCSADTALNDIKDLIAKGVMRQNDQGGRSTNYSLTIR